MGMTSGLSPRVRGNHQRREEPYPRPRSIPACAGEPVFTVLRWRAVAVYPRVCGGTLDRGDTACSDEGLSPRVRGNR